MTFADPLQVVIDTSRQPGKQTLYKLKSDETEACTDLVLGRMICLVTLGCLLPLNHSHQVIVTHAFSLL